MNFFMIPFQHTINTPYIAGPVHCYTAELGGDLVLFDTGPPTSEAEQFLRKNVDLKRLKHVLITHCHIDHYGQTAWIEKNSDATVYLPYRDCLKIDNHQARMDEMYHLLIDLGFGEEYLNQLKKFFASGALFPPFPEKYLAVEKCLPHHLGIEIINCPGHSQSDLIYEGVDWAVTGDTLLRGVFQCPVLDVDMEEGGRFKNYEAYCASLRKFSSLKSKLILPGHRKAIKGINSTLLYYISKMLLRVKQLHPYRDEGDLFLVVEKLLGGNMSDVLRIYLKASEIFFMKDFLRQPELLRDSLVATGLFEEVSALYQDAVYQL